MSANESAASTPPRLHNACAGCGDCYHPSFGPNTDGDPCDWCRDCGCASADHYVPTPGAPS